MESFFSTESSKDWLKLWELTVEEKNAKEDESSMWVDGESDGDIKSY